MIRDIVNWFRSKPPKGAILFVDGDQYFNLDQVPIKEFEQIQVISCHSHCTKHLRSLLKRVDNVTFESVGEFNTEFKGKETTDKYIAIQLQRYISAGYTELSIMSADADFYAIAEMLIKSNPGVTLKFTIYVSMKYPMEKHQRLKSRITTVFLPK